MNRLLKRLIFWLRALERDERGAWFIPLLIAVGFNVLAYFLLPKPKGPKPDWAADPENPTADAGRLIPFLAGTVTISGLNVIYATDKGHSTQQEDDQKFRRYHRTLHYGICLGPVDYISKIYIKEKLAWYGYWDVQTEENVTKEGLFGGNLKEGGVNGAIVFYPGDAAQQLTTRHAAKFGLTPSTSESYRGISSVMFMEKDGASKAGFYWGTSPYLPPVKVKAHRVPDVLDPALAKIERSGISLASSSGSAIELTWWQMTPNASGGDKARMGLAYFDSAGDQIGATEWQTMISISPGDTWVERTLSSICPSDAVTMRIYQEFERVGGDTSGGSIDDISVTVDGTALTVQNPGAESSADVGWTNEVGVMDTRGNTPDTHSGDFCFFGGNYASTRAYQELGDTTFDFDVNPAHMIYEAFTSTIFGIGESTEAIDTDSFTTAATTLYSEGFGLSVLITDRSYLKDYIGEILDHIQATLYLSPLTGLWTMTLIRNDYDVESLAVYSPDNAVVSKWSRKLWGETIGEVQVSYTNPDNEQSEIVIAHDLANIAANGTIVSDSRNYYMIRKSSLAASVAQRDIRASGTPLASCDMEANRTAWSLVPGAVVSLNSPDDGIDSMAMRVMEVDYGKPGDPTVRVSLVEDIFALGTADYATPPITIGGDESEDPQDAAYVTIMTLPYYMVLTEINSSWSAAYPETYSAVLAAQAASDSSEFELWSEFDDPISGTAYEYISTRDIAQRGLLSSALGLEVLSTITGIGDVSVGPGLETGAVIRIGEDDATSELALVISYDGVDYTLRRGVLDTIPREWPSGSTVWVIPSDLLYADVTPREAADSVNYKVLPQTSLGTLDIASASIQNATISGRPHLPSRPADVQVNADDGFNGTVDCRGVSPIPVTWANRNRLTETSAMKRWDAATVTGETNQTTTIYLQDLDENVIHAYTGLTGTSYDVDPGDFGSNPSGYIKVVSSRDGYESFQGYSIKVLVTSNALLLEDGSNLLLEDGARLLLE